jgi:hypothetical protein
MQKTLALLEKNVEWIALALGGLFVLWSAYAYVYIPPATVQVANQVLGPGEVSDFTNKLVKDMKRQITDTSNFKPIDVPQVVTAWEKQMGVPLPGPALPPYAFDSPTSSEATGITSTPVPVGAFFVSELVKLPKADVQPAQNGLSMVAIPGPAGPNGNAQPVANVATEDLAWVSLSAVVPATSLHDAFVAPLGGQNNNPQVVQQLDKLYKTAFLEVQLQRQRATGQVNQQPVFPPDDQGVETVAAPRIQKDDLEPMPDDKANAGSKAAFIHWAEGHLDVITQPKFYDVKAGDIWNSPAAAGAKPPAGGAAAGGVGRPAPNPPPLAVPNPNVPPAGANAAPGVINPLNVANDFVIWAHDETARPGEIYRYRLIYHMKNPVVDEQGIASPKIINVLDIASPPSDWSAPVAIARKTLFWVSSVNRNGTVQMDVFQYAQGQWQKSTTTPLWPGDPVPQTDLAIVDVHVGAGGMRDKYVLVADADGDIHKHSASERNDPKYKEMNDLVSRPAAPAATPVRGVPGGAPPPPPPMQTPVPHRTAAASGR